MKSLLQKSTTKRREEQHITLFGFIKGYFIYLYKNFIRP
ncbi:hypothetical protein EDC17_100119 [Sphingobacterium alimentarium]|uniref:Uncharacterized protein n=1 Tax=Sphingobacterium alimentarium TaxID=797292 RepID=A0A4R3W0H3_9SPHI|nr:hypothetical protein EDC17_100119 [Sphingobacterium alimentarium]